MLDNAQNIEVIMNSFNNESKPGSKCSNEAKMRIAPYVFDMYVNWTPRKEIGALFGNHGAAWVSTILHMYVPTLPKEDQDRFEFVSNRMKNYKYWKKKEAEEGFYYKRSEPTEEVNEENQSINSENDIEWVIEETYGSNKDNLISIKSSSDSKKAIDRRFDKLEKRYIGYKGYLTLTMYKYCMSSESKTVLRTISKVPVS